MGDGDNTYDFTDIPKLLEPLKRGEADLVLGSRFKGEIKKGKVVINCQAKIYMMKNLSFKKKALPKKNYKIRKRRKGNG